MNETETTNRGSRGRQVLTVLLLLGVVANLLLTLKSNHDITMLNRVLPKRPDLPCAAIPTRFVAQEPLCAQKLIEAMNITNFRVVANASELPGLAPRVQAPTR